jgi:hypothetical protein
MTENKFENANWSTIIVISKTLPTKRIINIKIKHCILFTMVADFVRFYVFCWRYCCRPVSSAARQTACCDAACCRDVILLLGSN